MRWSALLFLLTPLAVQAAPAELNIAVASGRGEPVSYRYPLNGEKRDLDLRESGRYHVAFQDKATNSSVCREAQYKTGLFLTFRLLPKAADDAQSVEVIGQVSELAGVKDGQKLSCGTNQEVSLSHRAFSDTVVVDENRTKVIVIDGEHTVMLKIQ